MNDRDVLGHAIRTLRRTNRLSIDYLARASILTKSTLQRAENGAASLNAGDVARLDAALRAGGELIALHQAIEGTIRRPLHGLQRNVVEAGHRWPAEWSGVVWVYVRHTQQVRTRSTIDLGWGPWRFHHEWQGGDLLLEDWKVRDDVSVGIHVRLSHRADVIFGAEDIASTDAEFVDLRGRWRRNR